MPDYTKMSGLQAFIITLVLIAFIGGIGAKLLVKTQDQMTDVISTTNNNDTLTFSNASEDLLLSNFSTFAGLSVTIDAITNFTCCEGDDATDHAGNVTHLREGSDYIFDSATGKLIIYNGSGVYNVTYTFNRDNVTGHQYVITNKGLEGILEVTDWLPTLALIVIATIIIGIIMYAFGRLQVRS